MLKRYLYRDGEFLLYPEYIAEGFPGGFFQESGFCDKSGSHNAFISKALELRQNNSFRASVMQVAYSSKSRERIRVK